MSWDTMTYDEQRAALGLADVKAAVAWAGLRRAAYAFVEAVAVAFTTAESQVDFGLARGDRS